MDQFISSPSNSLTASNSLNSAQLRCSKSLTLLDASSRSAHANLNFSDASFTSRRISPSSCSISDTSRPPRALSNFSSYKDTSLCIRRKTEKVRVQRIQGINRLMIGKLAVNSQKLTFAGSQPSPWPIQHPPPSLLTDA